MCIAVRLIWERICLQYFVDVSCGRLQLADLVCSRPHRGGSCSVPLICHWGDWEVYDESVSEPFTLLWRGSAFHLRRGHVLSGESFRMPRAWNWQRVVEEDAGLATAVCLGGILAGVMLYYNPEYTCYV